MVLRGSREKGIVIHGTLGKEGMGERKCRNCCRTADVGAYCQSCADRIMTKALSQE